jgi:hypothetical protein
VSEDAPRFLSRNGFPSYTNDPSRKLAGTDEALTDFELEEVADAAQRRDRARRRDAWQESKAVLERELAWLYSHRFQVDVTTQLRAVERQIMRLDDKLG